MVHVFDAMQVCGGGVLRALGAQVYGVIIAFISYYLIGLSIGLYLLQKTSIRVKGKYSIIWLRVLTLVYKGSGLGFYVRPFFYF